jgi:hypothetical protein
VERLYISTCRDTQACYQNCSAHNAVSCASSLYNGIQSQPRGSLYACLRN